MGLQVVAGLVHNATKYAPAGTGISVSVAKEKDRALVRVADEGPGVISVYVSGRRLGELDAALGLRQHALATRDHLL